jgi:hypothetical protein
MVLPSPALLGPIIRAAKRHSVPLTSQLLVISVLRQRMFHLEKIQPRSPTGFYHLKGQYLISTSRFGAGQTLHSKRTPLGLHRIAEKIGGGHPPGTVFKNREPVGYTWNGLPQASIIHRILWLQGLEPGFNQGGKVDSHSRYIYIHGTGNELALGRPASEGCIHLAGNHLIPLFDQVPPGALVWIE